MSKSSLLDDHTQWIDNSEMRVQVQRIRTRSKNDKLIVRVTEVCGAGQETSATRCLKVARNTAIKFGASGIDVSQIRDQESTKNVFNAAVIPTAVIPMRIRETCYAFGVIL